VSRHIYSLQECQPHTYSRFQNSLEFATPSFELDAQSS
jgi:hypothetical protein